MCRFPTAIVFAIGTIASISVAKADVCAPLRSYQQATVIAQAMSEKLRDPRLTSFDAARLLEALKMIITQAAGELHFEPYKNQDFLNAIASLTDKQAQECFPEYRKVLAAATTERLSEERQRIQQAELEWRRKQEGLPAEALPLAYIRYIFLRQCYEARVGYALIYLNSIELERARETTKRIEDILLKQEPTLDKDAAWKRAVDQDGVHLTMGPNYENCHSALRTLTRTWRNLDPASDAPKKDF